MGEETISGPGLDLVIIGMEKALTVDELESTLISSVTPTIRDEYGQLRQVLVLFFNVPG